MTSHAVRRVSWIRWHWLRVYAAPHRVYHAVEHLVVMVVWELDIWLEHRTAVRAARRGTDGAPFWGKTDPKIGDVSGDYDFPEDAPARKLHPEWPPLAPLPDGVIVLPYADMTMPRAVVAGHPPWQEAYRRVVDVQLPTVITPACYIPLTDADLPGDQYDSAEMATRDSSAGAGEPDLPGIDAVSGGRTHTPHLQQGDRSPAASDTSIDMDGWLIELLTCPRNRINGVAKRSFQRYQDQAKREVAAYLRELAEVAS